MTTRRRTLLATVLFLLSPTLAEARPPGAQQFIPLRLRIYGYVGEKPADIPPLATWVLTAVGKKYTFICDKIDVLEGNTSYMNVVQALAPYKPAFRLNGTKSTLEVFTTSPPKQRILMEGVLRFGGGARILMLDHVTAAPPATPPF